MKTSIKDWKRLGLKVTVCGPDGRALPEYDHSDSDPENHYYVKYIEVVPGESFSVNIRRSFWFWTRQEALYEALDGCWVRGLACLRWRRSSVLDGYHMDTGKDILWNQQFFGEMEGTKGGLPPDSSIWGKLGTIEVQMQVGTFKLRREKGLSVASQTPAFKGSTKHGLYTYIDGKTNYSYQLPRKMYGHTPKAKAPVLTFRFVYRTTEALQELGIIAGGCNPKTTSEKFDTESIASASTVTVQTNAPLIKTISNTSSTTSSSTLHE
ncbi:hypothetical protein CcaverHIS002_0410460 [Cutaneotrichosporon cavernicola]|uniref:DUF7918 domain-containing protein n=1 Tax=Cutaneotrichosporon cavernicola TaxID=279322 RepID=A0AA48L599_9TREE|nr:uncharacterized protein CcaverHIS019_0410360 [Cutaneotrichosporon cavernicola]BEI84442.1 hypothetical protein CcaverHIS002_0410460 [Cutaneotrichosporon cavernicola]BEI92216.1 hypothetical protein CcaverHIS019_0410360 [Cutaneotrichosporon cavernicola]BEI99987.1 hypothetical protein CcaverHIS631_0410300 [Cutaneotrichosporon cavernicola]BEJ07760.1 hypothetical protein CcaverHIS641_0410290 [Cutaneotrichosporon cavernicola]